MPPPITIRITGVNACNDLTITNNGQTKVLKGDTINWIAAGPNGIRIDSIFAKDGADDIWLKPPAPNAANTQWTGVVKQLDSGGVYPYNIRWKNREGVSYTYDPLIYIKPTTKPLSTMSALGIAIALVLVTVIITIFLIKRKTR